MWYVIGLIIIKEIIEIIITMTLYFNEKTIKITYLGLSIDYSIWLNY